jgi:hypothetical protein
MPSATPGAIGFVVAAWLVPGAGHLLLGRFGKAAVFFVVLTGMFAVGCGLDGRLFRFAGADWLTWLSALAQWGLGLPRVIAGMAGLGEGVVTAVTYEYGNTFLMAGGLLNALVMLNAFDLARTRPDA